MGRYNYYNRNSGAVAVSLAWHMSTGSYTLKFDSIGSNWESVKGVIFWIKKTIPGGERDYDDINKVWYIHEKYFATLRDIVNAVPEFNVSIFEKPIGASQTTFVPMETYFVRFTQLTGTDISSYAEDQFKEALKLYRRAALALHPDRNGGDGSRMADLNDSWEHIKERHFKIVRTMEQVNA
jgi:hypothetical protein